MAVSWKCPKCGNVVVNPTRPEKCPKCGEAGARHIAVSDSGVVNRPPPIIKK